MTRPTYTSPFYAKNTVYVPPKKKDTKSKSAPVIKPLPIFIELLSGWPV
jgi:hypothetical protein